MSERYVLRVHLPAQLHRPWPMWAYADGSYGWGLRAKAFVFDQSMGPGLASKQWALGHLVRVREAWPGTDIRLVRLVRKQKKVAA